MPLQIRGRDRHSTASQHRKRHVLLILAPDQLLIIVHVRWGAIPYSMYVQLYFVYLFLNINKQDDIIHGTMYVCISFGSIMSRLSF